MDAAVDAAGRVFVTDYSNHRVQVFDHDGRFLAAWGEYGTDAGEFAYALGVAVGGDGTVYVTDAGKRLQAFRVGDLQVAGSAGTPSGYSGAARRLGARLPWWQPLRTTGGLLCVGSSSPYRLLSSCCLASWPRWGGAPTPKRRFRRRDQTSSSSPRARSAASLASGRFEKPPAGPLHMGLLRFTNDPGSVSSGGGPDDPTGALILVESGEVTVRLEEPATITRTTGPEEVPADTDFTLGPGESFVWEPFVVGEIRNDGQEPAVTFAAFLAPADWEFEESTPMAGITNAVALVRGH